MVALALSIAGRLGSEVLSIRLRAVDRLVEAEVVGSDKDRARLRLSLIGGPVRKAHVAMGIDVEVSRGGGRFLAENVEVLELDPSSGELLVRGSTLLQRVRHRSSVREVAALLARVERHGRGRWRPGARLSPRAVLGRTRDVSSGGISLELDAPLVLEQGDEARVELELPRGFLSALARTAWTAADPAGRCLVGFSFVEADENGQDYLYRFLYDRQRRRA